MTEEAKDEWAELKARLDARTPPGWYGLACPEEWYKVIDWADKALAAIDPSYEVNQIKDKFGGLRYYYGSTFGWDTEQRKAMEAVVHLAEFAVSALEIARRVSG